jgi:hypothetical protein
MHPGLDYAKSLIGGVISGEGTDRTVLEAIDLLRPLLESGQDIDLIGFSRGAVTATLVAAHLGQFYADPRQRTARGRIRLTLLDPVPGPLFIQKSITLKSSLVRSVYIAVSKHEGRPGFAQLALGFDGDSSAMAGEMSIGGHPDIGGSNGSQLSKTHLRTVLKMHALTGPDLMTDAAFLNASFDGLTNPQKYTDRLKWLTRRFGHDDAEWSPTMRADMEFPSASTARRLNRSLLGRLLTGPELPSLNEQMERQLEHEVSSLEPATRQIIITTFENRARGPASIIVNPPATLQRRQVIYQHPRTVVLPKLRLAAVKPLLLKIASVATRRPI